MACESRQIHLRFRHGLGDCTYAAHQLQLYKRRGFNLTVDCDPEKRPLFEAFGISVEHNPTFPAVAWEHAPEVPSISAENHWLLNKAFYNLGRSPLPEILEPREKLFSEFAAVTLRIGSWLATSASKAVEEVEDYFSNLSRPIILLHTKGNSFQETKSLPDNQCLPVYRALLDEIDGTIILLDWDNRVPRASSFRLRHLVDDWKWLSVSELLAAVNLADLVIGVDSGPLHLSRFTDTPAIGLWLNGHHPCQYALPRRNQVNLALKFESREVNKHARIPLNIVEADASEFSPTLIARTARQMLSPARYLCSPQIGNAEDVQLRHFVSDFTRGALADGRSIFNDRDKGFDFLFRRLAVFDCVRIVETGCIRQEEDFRGAGFSTYLFGTMLCRLGKGQLDSVDQDENNIEFARKWTKVFGVSVRLHKSDSLAYFRGRSEPIDILYLDSMDADMQGAGDHGLAEIMAAERLLARQALVAYDDTSWSAGRWRGKGALGVPYLLARGWRIAYSGQQTILSRKEI